MRYWTSFRRTKACQRTARALFERRPCWWIGPQLENDRLNEPDKSPCALIVMGVSGSGKSTIATALAERLGWSCEDGDRFHPESNVAKMRAGHPLTDDDRWPWLEAIARDRPRLRGQRPCRDRLFCAEA